MEKEETIKKIIEADISKIDWAKNILERITDKYARGYMTAKQETLERHVEITSDQFRNNFLACCDYNIWGK